MHHSPLAKLANEMRTGKLGITIEWIDSGVLYGVAITMASVEPIRGALKIP